ncbi:hypothetical protein BSFA1_85370 (plasmid) [Burkholderia sp. SFA1]|nr:hypothetical protein BSFA1_85370 [Burkholderia sp. SFA1]
MQRVAFAADRLLTKGAHDFVVNDGASGFHRKHLHSKNFTTHQCQTGIFERSNHGVPQLNLIYFHGSVYWSKSGDKIEVKYISDFKNLLTKQSIAKLDQFSATLAIKYALTEDIPKVSLNAKQIERFWDE